MKRVGGWLGLAVVVVGGWIFLRSRPSRDGDVSRVVEAELGAAPSATAELVPARVAQERAAIPVVSEEPPAATTPGEDPAATPAERWLTGTIVVVDERQGVHPAESGSFRLTTWRGDMGEHSRVEVHGGRWQCLLSWEVPIDRLSVDDVRLGERNAAWVTPQRTLAWPEDERLELRAYWLADRVLHVRDLESGAELAGLELVEAPGFPDSERVHPGSLARAARALGDSPVAVSDARTHLAKRTLHVRAPGHAWGRIQFENDFGGEKTLMLGLACTLEVEVVGQVRDPETRLRILGDSSVPIFDELLTGSTVIDSLPPGKHRVRAEIGEFWSESLRLDEAEVQLSPDRPAHVTLTIEEPDVPPEVPLAGTLELPPEWNLADFELRFDLLDAVRGERDGVFFFSRSEVQETSPGLFRFSLPAVQAGRYDANIQELAFHQELLVAPPGLTDARIRVGPPCQLVVHCYEADSGRELEGAQVHVSWTSEIPAGLRVAHNKNATRDEQRRAWIARVPLAKIIVSASGSGFVSARPTIETVAGVNELRLDLARTCDLRVVLREGATDLAWDPAVTPELVPLEGQVLYRSQSSKEGAKILHEKEPGLYTLRIPRIPGYEPIPEANVRLERGKVSEHVVELVRLP